MSVKTFCDKCEREIQDPRKDLHSVIKDGKDFDLCDVCNGKINRWLFDIKQEEIPK